MPTRPSIHPPPATHPLCYQSPTVAGVRLTRRRALLAVGVVVVVVALAVVLISSGDSRGPFEDPPGAGGDGPGAGNQPIYAIGRTVTLRTSLITTRIRPLPFLRLSGGGSGGPFGGVLRIRNIGRVAYRDQPSQAASVRLEEGEEADRIYAPIRGCRGPSADSVRIVPGETRELCLAFAAAPRGLKTLLYARETGLPDRRSAPEAAAWAFG